MARPQAQVGGARDEVLDAIAGNYYALVITEDFSAGGSRIGKTCNLTIVLDGTFTLSINGGTEATNHKTVDTVVNGVEQSASFGYSCGAAGTSLGVGAIEFWNGGSVRVDVDPARVNFTPFANPTSKLRIAATHFVGRPVRRKRRPTAAVDKSRSASHTKKLTRPMPDQQGIAAKWPCPARYRTLTIPKSDRRRLRYA